MSIVYLERPAETVLGGARRLIVFLVFLCAATLADVAHAATPEEKAAARLAAQAGIDAFKNGEYDKAVSLLTKAEKLVHAPPHLLYIARAQSQLGRYVRAREALLALVNESLSDGVPQAFRDAQDVAKEMLVEIEPKIASLTVRVEGADEDVHVWVDGVEIPAAALGLPYPSDPGDRKLVAEAGGLRSGEVLVTLGEGESKDIILRLEFEARGATPLEEKAEDKPAPAPVEEEPVHESNKGMSLLVPVGFGVAGAGLLTGTITGLMSLGKAKSAKEFCSGDVCSPEAESDISSSKRLGTVANVSFVVAGIGVAAGVVGLLTGKPSSGSALEQAGLRPRLDFDASPISASARARWEF